MTQDIALLHCPGRDNVRNGAPDVSDDAVGRTVCLVDADAFVRRLCGDQWRTELGAFVGERDVRLSGN